ncbi:DICT sensory domain-containing protein [Natrarchaeobaculum sulfurireducens]|uniref:DICT domain-containing protein n=1 Tax=Natrarchaeobaculum sulfurireducens TaxID=2044521 RepID=A0A346PTP5_9EURY|nr:DICT sensory domain-containing protein [Natrarchaeobaculum sulfurireducens]AXR82890.1 hypothetical protein AArcMg_2901 [Natrarchaeobaculum sulfurireducens]
MTIRHLVDRLEPTTYTIAVVNDDEPGPLEAMLADAFDGNGIDIEATGNAETVFRNVSDANLDGVTTSDEDDLAVLLDDGEPVAASSMNALYESLLAINSDLFVTGARGLGEIELPNVLAGLEDTRLRLRGYPLAHKEKLLLIIVSRYIEQLACEGGSGTIRSAFQTLSRIEDELGTKEVYDQLAGTDVDVYVYGVDDGIDPSLGPTIHSGTGPKYRRSWFVVYRPDSAASAADSGALVCYEVEPRVWDGFYTFDADRVREIDDAITDGF